MVYVQSPATLLGASVQLSAICSLCPNTLMSVTMSVILMHLYYSRSCGSIFTVLQANLPHNTHLASLTTSLGHTVQVSVPFYCFPLPALGCPHNQKPLQCLLLILPLLCLPLFSLSLVQSPMYSCICKWCIPRLPICQSPSLYFSTSINIIIYSFHHATSSSPCLMANV